MPVSPNLPAEAPEILPHVAYVPTQRIRDSVFDAAIEGNNLLLQGLLAEGVDTNVYNNKGQSPLILAIEHGRDTTARVLIEKVNADVLNSCRSKRTPLMLAAERINEDIFRLLLDKGADVNRANYLGHTPLMIATQRANEHAVRLLLEREADVTGMDRLNETPLMCATQRSREIFLGLMLERGAYVNYTDRRGKTLLMSATLNGSKGAVRLLLDRGADVEARDNRGFTALDLVKKYAGKIPNAVTIIQWLEERHCVTKLGVQKGLSSG